MPEVLDRVKRWIGQITEVGLLLVALGIVIQILLGRGGLPSSADIARGFLDGPSQDGLGKRCRFSEPLSLQRPYGKTLQ